MNTPYTYLIGWSKLNKWYYGSRTAKNCHPDEFWKTYFTSSLYVRNFRDTNGDPDVIEIRKTFPTVKQCIVWESKVLNRLNAAKSDHFLNEFNTKSGYCTAGRTHAIDAITKVKLGLVDCNDVRWKTGEIISSIPEYTKFNFGFANAKDAKTGVFLGRISKTDDRWKTGEIVGIKKGTRGTSEKQSEAAKLVGKLNTNRVTVRCLETGKVFSISCDEYNKNKKVLYVAVSSGNRHGAKRITVYDLVSEIWTNVPVEEYYKYEKNTRYLTTTAAKKRGIVK